MSTADASLGPAVTLLTDDRSFNQRQRRIAKAVQDVATAGLEQLFDATSLSPWPAYRQIGGLVYFKLHTARGLANYRYGARRVR